MHPAESKSPTPRPPPARPLVVRLRNYIGDVVLALPTLHRLQEAGFALQLVGRRWAASLLEAEGWAVRAYPAGTGDRIALLKAMAADARRADPGFAKRLQAVVFPWSLSSALEMRLAGLRAVGHAKEGRSPLLARSVRRARGVHEMAVYWQLGDALLGNGSPLPPHPTLRVAEAHRHAAAQRLAQRGLSGPYAVVVPFASSVHGVADRFWPHFPQWVAESLPTLGLRAVLCPGPGEEALAARDYPGALGLEGLQLADYAAVLAGASLVVAGDTGPGHMAAAVGAPTVSILGPVTDPARWGALGPRVAGLRQPGAWPDPASVTDAARGLLASR